MFYMHQPGDQVFIEYIIRDIAEINSQIFFGLSFENYNIGVYLNDKCMQRQPLRSEANQFRGAETRFTRELVYLFE